MKSSNLTIQVPSDLIRQAKVVAAKRGTSLSAMLRDSLEEIVKSEDIYLAAGERFLASSTAYDVEKTWSREDLHERG